MKLKTKYTASERTKIDDHPLCAGLCFLICLFITVFYHEVFGEFGFNSSDIPWKISLFIQILFPTLILIQYITNRKTRRLWWEGIVALCIVAVAWLLLGSYAFVYFGFAPMPVWERITGLLPCFLCTGFWLARVWNDYVLQDKEGNLRKRLYIEETHRFIYSGVNSDGIVLSLPQRNPFTRAHIWLVSFFGPLLGGTLLFVIKIIPNPSGSHAFFLISSFLSFPLSQWILGYLGVRTLYFHIHLPLNIERETGKKVILVP